MRRKFCNHYALENDINFIKSNLNSSEVDEGNQADMEANDEAKVTVQDKEEADLELSKQRKKGEGGFG